MTLNCWEVREILWPQDRPHSYDEDHAEATAHAASCPSCQAFFRRDERLGRRLRALREVAAVSPSGLDGRVLERLETEGEAEAAGVASLLEADRPGTTRPAGRRTWVSELLTAAAALALLAGGYALSLRPEGHPAFDRFVQDYRSTAAMEVAAPGLESEVVERFYERELGFRIVPVSLPAAELKRATVCDLQGQRGSMVEYEFGGARLAHYRIPAARELAFRGPAKTGAVGLTSESGVQVVRWYDGVFENALVSEIPADRLERLAEERFVGR